MSHALYISSHLFMPQNKYIQLIEIYPIEIVLRVVSINQVYIKYIEKEFYYVKRETATRLIHNQKQFDAQCNRQIIIYTHTLQIIFNNSCAN